MMITVQEASSMIKESIVPLGIEELPLVQLQGRVLARDIVAPFSLPRFTNAAMDGFAVKWDDICTVTDNSSSRLHVTQMIPAGTIPTLPVLSRCCAEIMTGAPLPEGADTVVAVEQTSGFGSDYIEIYKAPKYGANVRYVGEEVASGDVLLCTGMTLSPSEIALLASFGFASATVQRSPRVSIVTVGDEVRMPGEELSGAQIYNGNRFMLEAACRSLGIEPVGIHHAPDEREQLHDVLETALSECDLLITSGGISVGEYDFVQEELSRLGVVKKFWNVAQKPGKPLYFGSAIDRQAVFSLPGNPVSALVCFVKYCVPALYALQGKIEAAPFQAILVEPFPPDNKRHRFFPGKVWAEGGRFLCKGSQNVESHKITSMVGSNCLIEVAPSGALLPSGSEVTCTMLPWAMVPYEISCISRS
jgi:molybdopterin molybdotransferase